MLLPAPGIASQRCVSLDQMRITPCCCYLGIKFTTFTLMLPYRSSSFSCFEQDIWNFTNWHRSPLTLNIRTNVSASSLVFPMVLALISNDPPTITFSSNNALSPVSLALAAYRFRNDCFLSASSVPELSDGHLSASTLSNSIDLHTVMLNQRSYFFGTSL